MFKKPIYRNITTFILVILLTAISISNQHYKQRITGDSEGYYAWLPTTIIYHEITFDRWADSLKSVTGSSYLPHYLHKEGTVLINKYTFGTALLMAPFFICGHLTAILSGFPSNGFSMPYTYAIALCGLFYGLLGLWFIYKIARSYDASPLLSWLISLILLFATNLYQYVVIQPAMSHVYSFTTIAAVVWLIRKDIRTPDEKHIWLIALLTGLIVSIRPFNIVFLLAFPFLFGSFEKLGEIVKRLLKPSAFWKAGLAGAFFPVVMMIVWELQTGYKIFYGYKGEGFLWDSPAIISFLFSFRKGWFIYTPIALTLFLGLFSMAKRHEYYNLISFSAFLILIIYMMSSWWSWWYGDGFGMRAMIDFYPVLIIPVILWLEKLQNEKEIGVLMTITIMLLSLNLLQIWQMHVRILLPDNMTRDKYWYIFLKTDRDRYRDNLGLQSEDLFRGFHRDSLLLIRNDFEKQAYRWSPWTRKMVNDSALSGSWVLRYDSTQLYSMSIGIDSASLFRHCSKLLVEGTFWYLEQSVNSVIQAPLVISIQSPDGATTFYKAATLKEVPDSITGMWRKAVFRLTAPAPDSGSEFKLYLWNKYHKNFYVDDFETTIFKITY